MGVLPHATGKGCSPLVRVGVFPLFWLNLAWALFCHLHRPRDRCLPVAFPLLCEHAGFSPLFVWLARDLFCHLLSSLQNRCAAAVAWVFVPLSAWVFPPAPRLSALFCLNRCFYYALLVAWVFSSHTPCNSCHADLPHQQLPFSRIRKAHIIPICRGLPVRHRFLRPSCVAAASASLQRVVLFPLSAGDLPWPQGALGVRLELSLALARSRGAWGPRSAPPRGHGLFCSRVVAVAQRKFFPLCFPAAPARRGGALCGPLASWRLSGQGGAPPGFAPWCLRGVTSLSAAHSQRRASSRHSLPFGGGGLARPHSPLTVPVAAACSRRDGGGRLARRRSPLGLVPARRRLRGREPLPPLFFSTAASAWRDGACRSPFASRLRQRVCGVSSAAAASRPGVAPPPPGLSPGAMAASGREDSPYRSPAVLWCWRSATAPLAALRLRGV